MNKFISGISRATVKITTLDKAADLVEVEFLTVQHTDTHQPLTKRKSLFEYSGAVFPESTVRAGIYGQDKQTIVFAPKPGSDERITLCDGAMYGVLIKWDPTMPNTPPMFLATAPIKEYEKAVKDRETADLQYKQLQRTTAERVKRLDNEIFCGEKPRKKQGVVKTPLIPPGIFMVKHGENWEFRGNIPLIIEKAAKTWAEDPRETLLDPEQVQWFKKEGDRGYVLVNTPSHLPPPNQMLLESLKKQKVAV